MLFESNGNVIFHSLNENEPFLHWRAMKRGQRQTNDNRIVGVIIKKRYFFVQLQMLWEMNNTGFIQSLEFMFMSETFWCSYKKKTWNNTRKVGFKWKGCQACFHNVLLTNPTQRCYNVMYVCSLRYSVWLLELSFPAQTTEPGPRFIFKMLCISNLINNALFA